MFVVAYLHLLTIQLLKQIFIMKLVTKPAKKDHLSQLSTENCG